jgi:hypothetical protein
MVDAEFAQAARQALETVSAEPLVLVTGQTVVPRDYLRSLAEAVADWPETPGEIWYGPIMRDCFWALVHQAPPPADGENERDLAEGLAMGVLLATTSADRGGFETPAYLAEIALAYMKTLPAWNDVQLEFRADDRGERA